MHFENGYERSERRNATKDDTMDRDRSDAEMKVSRRKLKSHVDEATKPVRVIRWCRKETFSQ